MTTIAPDCAASAAAWPASVAQRGACVAMAFVIFLLMTPSTFLWMLPNFLWMLVDSIGDAAWMEIVWVHLWPAMLACLALPFLGPRAVHEIIGPPLSARSAMAALACGLIVTVLFVVFTVFAIGPCAAPRAVSDPLFIQWTISAILVGPLAEEWLCRGVLWHAARRLFRPLWTIIITATVFTLAHGLERVREFPCLLLCGLLFGWLRHWSGSLSPSLL